MWTYNCARVYVGNYSYSKTYTYPETEPGGTYESCEKASCGYKVLKGSITRKQLSPIKRSVAFGEPPSPVKYHILETFVIYPITDIVLIAIFNHKGKHMIRLVKHQRDSKSTMYKCRL